MISKARLARLAGLFYLVVTLTGGFSQLLVRETLIEAGDASATADNISASASLFRTAFATDLINITFFLFAALTLYVLLVSVNAKVALAMVTFNAVTVAIMSLNMLNHFAALRVATSSGYWASANPEASDALAMLFVEMHSHGYAIAQIFFGLWLLPLGYLVYKSGYFPRVLGVMLMIGTVSYLTELVVSFLFPDIGANVALMIAVPAAIAEVSFLLWLLIRGVKTDPQPEALPSAVLADR